MNNKNNPIKIVIYSRVSTDEQVMRRSGVKSS